MVSREPTVEELSKAPTICRVIEFPNGGLTYIMGDSLPKTQDEKKQRDLDIARVCTDILLAKMVSER